MDNVDNQLKAVGMPQISIKTATILSVEYCRIIRFGENQNVLISQMAKHVLLSSLQTQSGLKG